MTVAILIMVSGPLILYTSLEPGFTLISRYKGRAPFLEKILFACPDKNPGGFVCAQEKKGALDSPLYLLRTHCAVVLNPLNTYAAIPGGVCFPVVSLYQPVLQA